MTRKLTAIQTSAGDGTRLWPLNLESMEGVIPKGILQVMDTYIAELQLFDFKKLKIQDVHVIVKGMNNRRPLSQIFGDGHGYGLRMYFSSPEADERNKGSGDAILSYIADTDLHGDSICLANDNIYYGDFKSAVEAHRDLGAVATILTTRMPPRATIESYGLVRINEGGRAIGIFEKPKNDNDIVTDLGLDDASVLPNIRAYVNTAGYLLNNDLIRKIAKERWVVDGRAQSQNFDMAGSFLKGLIKNDYHVHVIPIDAWGDFGTISTFLDAFPDALSGKFPSLNESLHNKRSYGRAKDFYHDHDRNIWIHKDSLSKKNSSGKTLENRIAAEKISLGNNVFIGRDVKIEDGANIIHSDIEEYSVIGPNTKLERAYVSPHCIIGAYAILRDCALGLDVVVQSNDGFPTYINGRSVIGPKITIPPGTRLIETVVFPPYKFEMPATFQGVYLIPTEMQESMALSHYNKELSRLQPAQPSQEKRRHS